MFRCLPYTEISFLECIGYLTASSGLQEMSELIYMYAPNAEWQGYCLNNLCILIVDAAINPLLLKSVFSAPLPEKAASNKNEDPDLTETAARPQNSLQT